MLQRYREAGRSVVEVPPHRMGETFAAWAGRVAPVLDEGHDVLFQMPLIHAGVRGIADFLLRSTRRGGCTRTSAGSCRT